MKQQKYPSKEQIIENATRKIVSRINKETVGTRENRTQGLVVSYIVSFILWVIACQIPAWIGLKSVMWIMVYGYVVVTFIHDARLGVLKAYKEDNR